MPLSRTGAILLRPRLSGGSKGAIELRPCGDHLIILLTCIHHARFEQYTKRCIMTQNANSANQTTNPKPPYVLSLDVGTSSTRTLLFDATGASIPGVHA